MIPIKGYATFHPLKHCWIGSGFKTEWFENLSIYKNNKIMDPLKRIAEETEEDYQTLEKILNNAGVKTYRSFLDRTKYSSLEQVPRPPVCPRDHFAVIGKKIYVSGSIHGYQDVLKKINRENINVEKNWQSLISTAVICRVGMDLWWDYEKKHIPYDIVNKYKEKWTAEGFRVHLSTRGYHTDGTFCVVRPGLFHYMIYKTIKLNFLVGTCCTFQIKVGQKSLHF